MMDEGDLFRKLEQTLASFTSLRNTTGGGQAKEVGYAETIGTLLTTSTGRVRFSHVCLRRANHATSVCQWYCARGFPTTRSHAPARWVGSGFPETALSRPWNEIARFCLGLCRVEPPFARSPSTRSRACISGPTTSNYLLHIARGPVGLGGSRRRSRCHQSGRP